MSTIWAACNSLVLVLGLLYICIFTLTIPHPSLIYLCLAIAPLTILNFWNFGYGSYQPPALITFFAMAAIGIYGVMRVLEHSIVGSNENLHELIPETELPFKRVPVGGLEEDDEEGSVGETINAWVVDIPDPQQMAVMIQWLKQAGLGHPSLKHAKHVRKWTDSETSPRISLLLTPADRPAPVVPGGLSPYITAVPRFPARTIDQVKLKATTWPVFYEAQNHRELQEESRRWTRATVQWFRDAVVVLKKEAERVRLLGELPIVSYVPVPLDAPPGTRSFIAHDMRVSSRHPLRHAVFNLIRLAGDVVPPSSKPNQSENGQNYLLTSRTLFITHEPCIACSMALLHSRVKEVVYLHAMPQTGGCGSITCVPGLKGVNHRFKLWKWRGMHAVAEEVQAHIDT